MVREAAEPVRDAFAGKLSGAKKYELIRGNLYVMVTDSKDARGKSASPDERAKIQREIFSRRQQDYATRFLQGIFTSSKVEKNDELLKSYGGGEG
jgi:hypothetical protein